MTITRLTVVIRIARMCVAFGVGLYGGLTAAGWFVVGLATGCVVTWLHVHDRV